MRACARTRAPPVDDLDGAPQPQPQRYRTHHERCLRSTTPIHKMNDGAWAYTEPEPRAEENSTQQSVRCPCRCARLKRDLVEIRPDWIGSRKCAAPCGASK